jgi:hypothetical protein
MTQSGLCVGPDIFFLIGLIFFFLFKGFPVLLRYIFCFEFCASIYFDVLLESRNIGARVYDHFLDNGLAKRLDNSRRPSLYHGNTARTCGERYCDTTHWLEAFPLQRNSYTTCSRYGPRRDYTREKTFSSEVSAQIAINQRTSPEKAINPSSP